MSIIVQYTVNIIKRNVTHIKKMKVLLMNDCFAGYWA